MYLLTVVLDFSDQRSHSVKKCANNFQRHIYFVTKVMRLKNRLEYKLFFYFVIRFGLREKVFF